MQYASIPRRIIAYLIDSTLVFVVFIMFTQTFFFVPIRPLVIGSEDWFRSAWQAPPAKRFLKLKTVDKKSGNRLTLFQAVIRTLVKLAPWEIAHLTNNLPVPMWYETNPNFRIGFIAVPVLILLYIITGFATQTRQNIPDIIANTVVIYNG